jgi:hypothetical protein
MSKKLDVKDVAFVTNNLLTLMPEIESNSKLILTDFYKGCGEFEYIHNLLYQMRFNDKYISDYIKENLLKINEFNGFDIEIKGANEITLYFKTNLTVYSNDNYIYINLLNKTYDEKVDRMFDNYKNLSIYTEPEKKELTNYDILLNIAKGLYDQDSLKVRFEIFKKTLELKGQKKYRSAISNFIAKREVYIKLINKQNEYAKNQNRIEKDKKESCEKIKDWLDNNEDKVREKCSDVIKLLDKLGYKKEYKKYWS